MKKKLFLVLIFLFIAHLAFRIYEYRQTYLTPFDANYWKLRYEYSQWSTKPACEMQDPHYNPYTCIWDDQWYDEHKNDANAKYLKKNAIGDDGLYAYAGWEYIHGKDPTTLNAELPPFGKYLIGLSEVIFHNQNIFALLSGIFALGAFYLFALQLFKDRYIAVLPVVIFSFEPLFYTQLRAPFLDLLYLGLLLMTMYCFLKKQFIASSIFLGLMAATKSPASTFLLVICVLVLYLLITKQFKVLKKYTLSLPLAGLSFLLTYIQYFMGGHTIIDFLKVQKWIVNFYAEGAKGSLTAPWELLFTGRYNNWWGEQSIVSEWHFGWSLLVLISAFALFILVKHDRKSSMLLICVWVVSYLLFLSFVPLWSRYLLLLLPFMYTLVVYCYLIKSKVKKAHHAH